MHEDASVSRQDLFAEIESLHRDLRHTRVLTVCELFAATVLLLFWYGHAHAQAYLPGRREPGRMFVVLMAFPAVLNVTAWIIWAASGFLHGLGARSPRHITNRGKPALPEYKHLLTKYDWLRSTLRRHRGVGRRLEMLIALQFILSGLVLILRFLGYPR